MADLKSIEQDFAYQHATGLIEGCCVFLVERPDGHWIDLSSAEADLSDEIAYLDSRRLIMRATDNPKLIQICDEDEPLPEPERTEILLTPVGMQTPEGAKRARQAMNNHKAAIVCVANAASEFDRKHGYHLDRIAVSDEDFREDLDELRENIAARNAALDEMLRAVAGQPKGGK